MGRESDIAIEHAIALSDVGKNTGRRLYPTHDEIAQLAFGLHIFEKGLLRKYFNKYLLECAGTLYGIIII